MIEAKTWIPKEVFWQPPSKKGMGSERTQFSPGKEKASRDHPMAVRMGAELDKRSGSPFDHGGAAAEYIRNRGTSPSQNSRKPKQSSLPYPSPAISASGIDGDRAKQLDRHSGREKKPVMVIKFFPFKFDEQYEFFSIFDRL